MRAKKRTAAAAALSLVTAAVIGGLFAYSNAASADPPAAKATPPGTVTAQAVDLVSLSTGNYEPPDHTLTANHDESFCVNFNSYAEVGPILAIPIPTESGVRAWVNRIDLGRVLSQYTYCVTVESDGATDYTVDFVWNLQP